jgi:hypothetical protein
MRAGELLNLTWRQVDLECHGAAGGDQVQASEGGAAIRPSCGHFCSGPERPGRPYVLVNPKTVPPNYITIKKGFHGACRRAGITDFRFHDLRHTFASWAVQSGMDLCRLSRVLGHSTSRSPWLGRQNSLLGSLASPNGVRPVTPEFPSRPTQPANAQSGLSCPPRVLWSKRAAPSFCRRHT